MEPITASAGEGWQWYVRGWKLFIKNPAVMVGQLIVLLIIAIILNLVPVVGNLALALITPVLAGGWYFSIQQLENNNPASIADIFEGFRNQAWTKPLLVLGAAILATHVLVGVVVVGLLGLDFLTDMSAFDAGAMNLTLGFGGVLAISLVLLLAAALLTAMFYAIPLVLFRQAAPIAALRNSFAACLQNVMSLLVFGLVYLVASFLAAIPLGLGFLVLIPVSVCAAYCSYKTVYQS